MARRLEEHDFEVLNAVTPVVWDFRYEILLLLPSRYYTLFISTFISYANDASFINVMVAVEWTNIHIQVLYINHPTRHCWP